jgi:hypothetical protein
VSRFSAPSGIFIFAAGKSFGERNTVMSVVSSGWALGLNETLLEIVLDIRAAQLLDTVGVPIPVVPAPGVGKAALIVACFASYRAGSVPFNPGSFSANPSPTFAYVGPSGFSAISMPSFSLYQLLTQPASAVAAWFGGTSTLAFPRNEIENESISLVNTGGVDAATNFTEGDGSLRLTIIYVNALL